MSEKPDEVKTEARARLLRQGGGNYANLCGVLAGFVSVILVLTLTPGFFPDAEANPLFELITILFSISSFGYIIAALRFIHISSTPLSHWESLNNMIIEYAFDQALVVLLATFFLGGVVALAYSTGAPFMTITAALGLILLAGLLIRDWWALARRSPRKQKEEKRQ